MALPIYLAEDKEQVDIIQKIEELLKKLKNQEDTSELENKIDMLVYKIYALTEKEIQNVECFVEEQRNL